VTGIEIPSGKLNEDDAVPDASVNGGSGDSEGGDVEDEDEKFVEEDRNKPEAKKDASAEKTPIEGQQQAEPSK
jgi:hypothetical protein